MGSLLTETLQMARAVSSVCSQPAKKALTAAGALADRAVQHAVKSDLARDVLGQNVAHEVSKALTEGRRRVLNVARTRSARRSRRDVGELAFTEGSVLCVAHEVSTALTEGRRRTT